MSSERPLGLQVPGQGAHPSSVAHCFPGTCWARSSLVPGPIAAARWRHATGLATAGAPGTPCCLPVVMLTTATVSARGPAPRPSCRGRAWAAWAPTQQSAGSQEPVSRNTGSGSCPFLQVWSGASLVFYSGHQAAMELGFEKWRQTSPLRGTILSELESHLRPRH